MKVLDDVRRASGDLPPGEEEDGKVVDRFASASNFASDETWSGAPAGDVRQRHHLPLRHRRIHDPLVREHGASGDGINRFKYNDKIFLICKRCTLLNTESMIYD